MMENFECGFISLPNSSFGGDDEDNLFGFYLFNSQQEKTMTIETPNTMEGRVFWTFRTLGYSF